MKSGIRGITKSLQSNTKRARLMKKTGITEEEDEKWHRGHQTDQKAQERLEKRSINPFAIGGGFLSYCVEKGWLIQEGRGRNARYYIAKAGEKGIKKFGIMV